MSQHILLSSMGVSDARDTTYFFSNKGDSPRPEDEVVTSGFSALALWQLLPKESRPDEVWFILTPEAKEKAWNGILAEAAKTPNLHVKPLSMDPSQSADDSQAFLSATAEQIPPGVKLTLDVTQGLRHHAFLFLAFALYASKFRGNQLEGVWYARIETKEALKPIIDLKPVLELTNWFLALSEFQDTGSLKAMSRLVSDRRVQKLLCQLSQEFLTGLPVEAGITASQVVKILEDKDQEGFSLAKIPLEQQVRELVLSGVEPLAGTYTKKSECRLEPKELERQAAFIQRYLDTGQANLAYGFMREWTISQVLAKDGVKENWLDLKQRSRAEGQLGCLSNLNAQSGDPNREKLSEDLKTQAKRWEDLGGVRNALQHHGMRPDEVPRKPMKRLKKCWGDRENWAGLPVFGGGKGTLLICPLGNTAGVLYSALLHVQPERCLVLCSPQTESAIEEALSQVGWQGELQKLIMQDVHRGVTEFGGLLNQAKIWLFEADRIEANLTGGTSLMGVLVGRLLEHAGRTYRRPTRRFVLIDPRPYEEQRAEPWVKGDIHYIDGKSEQAGGEG